ncbi:MAG: hypothetical protein KGJ62_14915 [Armatimonadetes bacterium]|nr:hypothetical protein [Armatimonadota bacterium]MDE2206171.1 hypothetical protein [Armatimonadota bacterium]
MDPEDPWYKGGVVVGTIHNQLLIGDGDPEAGGGGAGFGEGDGDPGGIGFTPGPGGGPELNPPQLRPRPGREAYPYPPARPIDVTGPNSPPPPLPGGPWERRGRNMFHEPSGCSIHRDDVKRHHGWPFHWDIDQKGTRGWHLGPDGRYEVK